MLRCTPVAAHDAFCLVYRESYTATYLGVAQWLPKTISTQETLRRHSTKLLVR